jgi:hypothetical protein
MKPNFKHSSKYFLVQEVLAFLSSLLGCTSLELLLVAFLFSHLSILKMKRYFVKNKWKKELDTRVTASQTNNYVAHAERTELLYTTSSSVLPCVWLLHDMDRIMRLYLYFLRTSLFFQGSVPGRGPHFGKRWCIVCAFLFLLPAS